jgi:hypothetical protein
MTIFILLGMTFFARDDGKNEQWQKQGQRQE